jgi:hypothetical protein
MNKMVKLQKYILKNYGDLKNQELAEIYGDLWNHVNEGTGDANEISQRFVKWEKRHQEKGL